MHVCPPSWLGALRRATPCVPILGLALLACACCPAEAAAQSGANVLIVVNEASAVSVRVGEYYAARRGVPTSQVLRIKVQEADEVSRRDYERAIEGPVAQWLAREQAQDRILYIVLTKGVPLRIQGSVGRSGTVASVDSELALLYRRMTGTSVTALGQVQNPYYLGEQPLSEARPYTHRTHDVFLVTRLDGFTAEDVIRLVDRGIEPKANGRFVLDGRAALDDPGNEWLRAAARRLESGGLGSMTLIDLTSRILDGEPDVIGYYSWGSTDPSRRARTSGARFLPGAIGAMFVSTDARTFAEPPAAWTIGDWEQRTSYFAGSPQSLTGDLVRDGITGAAGHVAEPYLDGSVRPQILFPAYAAGFNLAEAFYLSIPSLSWQTVVVGDPLCAPFPRQVSFPDPIDRGLDAATETPTIFAGRRLRALLAPTSKTEALQAFMRAESRLARAERGAARAALEEAVRLQPTLVQAQLVLASLLEESSEWDGAIGCYRRVLETSPNDIGALNNLAYALAVRKGLPGDGLPLAERAYTLTAAVPAARPSVADTLGWIRHLLGNDREALRLIAEAVRLAPDTAEMYLHLAVVQAAGGDLRAAAAALARAIELDARLSGREEAKRVAAQVR